MPGKWQVACVVPALKAPLNSRADLVEAPNKETAWPHSQICAEPFSLNQSWHLIWTLLIKILLSIFWVPAFPFLFLLPLLFRTWCEAWCDLWLWTWILLMAILALPWLYFHVTWAYMILVTFGPKTFRTQHCRLWHWLYQVQSNPLGRRDKRPSW